MVASRCLLLLASIASFLSLSSSQITPAAPPSSVIFPVAKDEASRQYYTTIALGTPPSPVKAVLDLSGSYSWFDCGAARYDPSSSSSHRRIVCSSARCRAARGGGCFNDTCGVYVHNPLTEVVIGAGLGEDAVVVHHTDGIKYTSRGVVQLPFSCVPSEFTRGTSRAGNGVIALSIAPTSLATKLSADLNLPHKLALCLPSSSSSSGHGDFYVGGGPYFRPPIKQDLSKSLLVTQLLIDPVSRPPSHGSASPSDQYFVDVTAIKVNFSPVNFNASLLSIDEDGRGGTKISTLTPYTVLHSDIYRALVGEFSRQAAEKKIRRAEPIAPFGACFDLRSVRSRMAGPDVPVIVLVLQGDAQWRIDGANSMVRVSQEAMCLGFVEGGTSPMTAIVIGAHQMEDNLVEFDMAAIALRFSNSLLLRNTSCSHS
ncbi:probable aspartic proteinase GIP2 [Rhodamnia argentea]|uniref:Probable aspartic proteinase GIP2 n=1 Tax=Rhodamnia argentea TaxID=178133 RepID=A0A8B8QMB6_9MYRT|nr:probable aspartic proteinase GIP2 [Rhodamnia argentea]